MSIGSAVFAWLTTVMNTQTNRHTDRPRHTVYYNKTDRCQFIDVCSTKHHSRPTWRAAASTPQKQSPLGLRGSPTSPRTLSSRVGPDPCPCRACWTLALTQLRLSSLNIAYLSYILFACCLQYIVRSLGSLTWLDDFYQINTKQTKQDFIHF